MYLNVKIGESSCISKYPTVASRTRAVGERHGAAGVITDESCNFHIDFQQLGRMAQFRKALYHSGEEADRLDYLLLTAQECDCLALATAR